MSYSHGASEEEKSRESPYSIKKGFSGYTKLSLHFETLLMIILDRILVVAVLIIKVMASFHP